MSDTTTDPKPSPAYSTALDQLRAERDAAVARAEAAEKQWEAIAKTPDGGWHVGWQASIARAVAAERDRDAARDDAEGWRLLWDSTAAELATAKARLADLEAAEKERDDALNYLYSLGWYYGRPREPGETVESWSGRITAAIHADQRTAAEAELEALNEKLRAEGHAAVKRAELAERQHVDAAAKLEAVTTERDHMRSVVPELEAQLDHWKGRFVAHPVTTELDDLRAKLTAAENCAAMHERDAAERKLAVLQAMFHAAIKAAARTP